jgi:CheY-like chemotaxis protein
VAAAVERATVTLPIEGAGALELPNRPRVLVVEDEALIAFALEDRLRKAGAQIVGPFASVQAALAAIDDGESIDAAVLDIKLSEGNVFQVAERLKEMGVPFGFSTGLSEEEIPARFQAAPVWVKPSHDGDIVAWLAGLAPDGA